MRFTTKKQDRNQDFAAIDHHCKAMIGYAVSRLDLRAKNENWKFAHERGSSETRDKTPKKKKFAEKKPPTEGSRGIRHSNRKLLVRRTRS